jgi:Family of unknown function (DUF6011)
MTHQIADLKSKLGKLGQGDRKFADSLISAFQGGRLTPGQAPWVGKLLERANGTDVQRVANAINVGSFANVIALFAKAKEHLKWPKITLSCDGVPVILSVCGPKSKTPGSINIGGPGVYPAKPWYGRITPEGEWSPSRTASSLRSLPALLTEFGTDPAGVAKKYGLLTGNCCFCNLALSDLRSTAAGFGPTCAVKWGLKNEWNTAAKVAA